MTTNNNKGSLKIVGTGINVIEHISQSAITHIENADQVYTLVTHAAGFAWLQSLNTNCTDLGSLYAEGKSRVQTYRQMIDTIAFAVRNGQRVCAVFYGHPGVFVDPGHQLIRDVTQ